MFSVWKAIIKALKFLQCQSMRIQFYNGANHKKSWFSKRCKFDSLPCDKFSEIQDLTHSIARSTLSLFNTTPTVCTQDLLWAITLFTHCLVTTDICTFLKKHHRVKSSFIGAAWAGSPIMKMDFISRTTFLKVGGQSKPSSENFWLVTHYIITSQLYDPRLWLKQKMIGILRIM